MTNPHLQSHLPAIGNSFLVARPFLGLQAGTELRVHSHQGDNVLLATRSGSTSVKRGNYYQPILVPADRLRRYLEPIDDPFWRKDDE